ncbi:hypothetical protein JZO70_06250 [Enterococcus sp. 669A]|uniref:Uncharacterized protein n=1 Tax=Candidatus Enterococcus moelleringii TaxID=2815325 RepID=A0ABS3L809_9ENTE|nr:hypothetical protein [Enterococcus sp. 669A]MBO1305750.1 hypothetical protein [Enterococcus sp. 669A]
MKKISLKKKYLVGLLLVLGIAVVGGSLLWSSNQKSEPPKKKVSAHPTNEIVINKDTTNKYTVGKDATGKVEDTIPADYVQRDKFYYRFRKDKIDAYIEPYFGYGNSYTLTYFENRIPIDEKHDAIVTYGYRPGLPIFAGSAAVMVDKSGTVVTDNTGLPKAVRSSPIAPWPPQFGARYTHQAGPGGLVNYPDGNFGLITGPYDEAAVYTTRFNNEFNVTTPTTSIPLTGSSLPVMTPYGGYMEGDIAYLQVHNRSDNASTARLVKVNLVTQTVEGIETYKILPSSSFLGNYVLGNESQLNFGGYDYAKQFMKTSDGGTIGAVHYRSNPENTFLIVVYKWDAQGEIEYWTRGPHETYAKERFTPCLSISDENYYYFWKNGSHDSDSRLCRIDLKNPGETNSDKSLKDIEVVKILPKTSLMQLQKENATDTYFFQGYVSELTDELRAVGIDNPGVIMGQLDKNFNVISGQTVEANGYTWFTKFDFDPDNPTSISVEGSSSANNFMDKKYQDYYNRSNANYGTAAKEYYQYAFWGDMTAFKNYAPAIKVEDNIQININQFSEKNAFEQELLSKVSVTDTFDLGTGINGGNLTQDSLDKRINRNPNDLSLDIDWEALGIDRTKPGPHQTTFFVTDSTKLETSTSKWVDLTTNQTVIENKFALDAQNFSIPLTDVGTITDADVFKKLAKTTAWNMTDHTVDEDSSTGKLSPKVTVNAEQLAAVQNAKVAKPYPVDVTYAADGTTSVTNRVWVFVTTKNTKVDTNTGIVIYANDYSLPVYLAAQETLQDVYTHSDVKVYDYYDSTHESDPELPTLADKDTITGLGVTNLNVITGATTASVVQPEITYTGNSQTTSTTVDVTIITAFTLHARQVIVDGSDELVVPTKGYLQLENTADRVVNLEVDSAKEDSLPNYRTADVEVDNKGGNNTVDFKVVVPEYYEYLGYVVTDADTPHQSSSLTGTSVYRYDFTSGDYEKWLTVYLKPKFGSEGAPNMYGWDYEENDLGEIEPDGP